MHFCYRHPTYIAKRKCFHCQRHICPHCQVKAEKHIFCGAECVKEYTRKIKVEAVKATMKKPLASWIVRTLFYSGIAAIFLLAIILIRNFITMQNAPGQKDLPAIFLPAHHSGETKELAQISKPANGLKTSSRSITVEGKAPSGSVVGLYLNGELVTATTTQSPEYVFENVLLTKRENVVQIKSYNDKGSIFSNAIIVYYVTSVQSGLANSYSQPFEDNISRGNTYRKEIAITFDGGSIANEAEAIVTILKENKIKTTFFLTGEFIKNYPDIVKKIIQDGHEVGNHTYSHPHLTTYSMNHQQTTLPTITREFINEELRKTDELFNKITGRHLDPYWRAPFGETNPEIRKWASELGYMHIGWTNSKDQSLDSMDWIADSSFPAYRTTEQITMQILEFGKGSPLEANGGIILMHLGTERKDKFAEKFLPLIIDGYNKKGYRFVTIGYMILHKDDIFLANK